jgi:dienelactone hydrolase
LITTAAWARSSRCATTAGRRHEVDYVAAVPDDVLAGYDRTTFTYDDKTRDVFRRGTGPAVVVIAEIPGITPKVVEFADRVVDIGCTAVLPHLFGDPGRDPLAGGRLKAVAYALSSIVPACISREFTVLATGRTSPVVSWLRALAADEHARCGGPGVGAVGMCFTGGFALAMATDDRLLAPVLSQPSLPFAIGAGRKRNIDISAADLEIVQGRCANDNLRVLGLRFEGDRYVPAERFQFLADALGEAFVAVPIADDAANPDAPTKPHSVLTEHLIDEPGQPTRDALDQVLDLFRSRLLGAG